MSLIDQIEELMVEYHFAIESSTARSSRKFKCGFCSTTYKYHTSLIDHVYSEEIFTNLMSSRSAHSILSENFWNSWKQAKHMIAAIQLSESDRMEFIYNFIMSSPYELYPEFHIKWFEIHTVFWQAIFTWCSLNHSDRIIW